MPTKKELLAVDKRKWDEELTDIHLVYIIPSARKHDSGYNCMDCVAVNGEHKRIRFGGGCDDLKINGNHFSIDCEDGILRIWNRIPFTVSHDTSSIDLTEQTQQNPCLS